MSGALATVFILVVSAVDLPRAAGFGGVEAFLPLVDRVHPIFLATQHYAQLQHLLPAAPPLPPFPDLPALYQHALHEYPQPTQMATGAVLAVAGDLAAQAAAKTSNNNNNKNKSESNSSAFDVKRTLSFAAFDAAYRAVQHVVYPPMKEYFHGQFITAAVSSAAAASSSWTHAIQQQHLLQHYAAAAEQSLVSQLVIVPLVYYPIFFAVTGLVQGLTYKQALERGVQSFVPLMRRNLLFWIPVQFGVFGWVHDDAMQISILIAFGFLWTMILSAAAGSAQDAAGDAVGEKTASGREIMRVTREIMMPLPPPDDVPVRSDAGATGSGRRLAVVSMSNSTTSTF